MITFSFSLLLSILLAIWIIFLLRKIASLQTIHEKSLLNSTKIETESKHILQRNNDLKHILHSIPSGILILDLNGKITTVNRGFVRQFSVEEKDLIGYNLGDVLHNHAKIKGYQIPPAGYKSLLDSLETHRSTLRPVTNKIENLGFFDPAPRFIRYSLLTYEGENNVKQTVMMCDDISEYVKAARLRHFSTSVSASLMLTESIDEFYKIVHTELNKVIPAENFYIALKDTKMGEITFPYFVDQIDRKAASREFDNSLSDHVIKTGEAIFLEKDDFEYLKVNNHVVIHGTVPKVYLAAPLKVGDETLGIIAVQDYNNAKVYQRSDKEIIRLAAEEIALALDRRRIMEAINHAKVEWEQTVDVLPELIAIIDNNQTIVRVNRTMAEKIGINPQEAVGLTIKPIKDGLEAEIPIGDHFRIASERRVSQIELFEMRWNGDFLINVNPLHDKHGNRIGFVYSARDITDTLKSQVALEESEEKFATIFQKSLDMTWIIDPMTQHILAANPITEQILGYRPDEIVGKSFTTIFPQERRRDRTRLLEQLQVTGSVFESQKFKQPNGLIVELDLTASLIPWTSGKAILATFRNVTERVAAEEKVRLSEEFNRALVTIAPIGIAYLESDGRITFMNPALISIIQSNDNRDPLPDRVQNLFSKENSRIQDALLQLFKGETIRLEEVAFHNGDAIRNLNVHGAPRYGAGNLVLGAVLMVVDVTEYKKLQAQLRHALKMEAVGTLAGGIAHDFNNLLTAILGNTQLVMMKVAKDSAEYISLEAIKRSADRAAELTSQLLAFGMRRMEQPHPINLNRPVDEVIKLLKRTIDPRIEIFGDKAIDLWVVMADLGQMHQVLMNLVMNARDAMKSGGEIRIKTENVVVSEVYTKTRSFARKGEHVLLSVTDNGVGISEENLPHIFDPFFTTKQVGEGSGLGLAMVYSIVKAHNGWIEVSSKINEGARFEIYLPKIDKPVNDDSSSSSEPLPGGTEKILLIDDQQLVLDVGRKILENVGYEVVTASDGSEALKIFEDRYKYIDLVILDLSMPKQSGREILPDLLKVDPDAKIIVSSGFDKAGPVQDLLELGAKGFLHKPYRMHELLQVIRHVLDKIPIS